MGETQKTKSGWRSFVWKVFRWLVLLVGAIATFTAGQFLIRRFSENSVPADKNLYRFVNVIAIAFCLWLLRPILRRIVPLFARLAKSFYQWFFTWQVIRRALVGLAILATLIAVFYTEENWRGKRAWENYKRKAEARGEVLDWAAYIPKPAPADQNIFKAPKMTEWFVKPGWMSVSSAWVTNELSKR